MFTVRPNRILSILFGLLIFTFILPVFLNVFLTLHSAQPTPQPKQSYVYHENPANASVPDSGKKFESDDNTSRFETFLNISAYTKSITGDSLDVQLAYRFADLNNRVKYAEMIASERKEEIYRLLQDIRNLWSTIREKRQQNDQRIIEDSMTDSFQNTQNSSMSMQEEIIKLPSLLSLMPHLTSSAYINPAIRIARASSSQKSVRRFVFGIPTVKRLVESYLIATLKDLLNNLSAVERQQSVFVVFIAEIDIEFVRRTADEIMKVFGEEINQGLIEIISPPLKFYPDFSRLKPTLGDTLERVRWRSKQNFDFAYLMMYCRSKGTYYVQLEDDIISKPSYLTKIESFIAKNAVAKKDWLILDFCSLGFIGKLFRTSELSHLILFFIMFHNDKPVDWLLDNYVQTKVCRFDKDSKDCKRQKNTIWLTHKPSLFQHIGTHSSLKGKIQKLRDRAFGKMKLFEPHMDNPPAETYSTFKHYQRYRLDDAYEGNNFFWGVSPIKGDQFGFKYDPPVELESCLIRTGNLDHPMDIVYNATFQAKPSKLINHLFKNQSQITTTTPDGFVNLAQFEPIKGLIDVKIPNYLNPIQELRVVFERNLSNWIIINEIHFKKRSKPTTIAL